MDGYEDLPSAKKEVDPYADIPSKPFGKKALEFIEPTAEALGTAGGAALGSFLGPVGTVGGAGLGYGITKELLGGAKRMAGYEPPRTPTQKITEPVENILTGATYEAGGRALPSILGGIGKIGTTIGDIIRTDKPSRAAKIAGEALGPNLQQARQILKQSSDDLSASQALATLDPKTGEAILTAPTAQALLKRAEARDPEFFMKLFGEQEAKARKSLEAIAGGSNETAARQAREQMKKDLNERLIPTLKTELQAANIAGRVGPKLGAEAERMGKAATQKVEDVRRFTAAGPRGEALARSNLITKGLPVGATKYTYLGGDLPQLAEKVAQQSADASLAFGQASRFADAAKNSLEAHGLRPLSGDRVIASLQKKLSDPAIAGNRELQTALTRVGKDIKSWTNNGGVIDAFALDAIRKNSINSVAQQLFKDDKKAQKEFAGIVLEKVKPVLIDAIENAGGTGYRQYLTDYAIGSQQIAQTKLGGEALRLFQSSPRDFVKLVELNSPETVESIFGPGNYNLAKEMSSNLQQKLGSVAKDITRGDVAAKQAAKGTTRLEEILKTNLPTFKLPSFLSTKVTISNEVLDKLEGYTSKETMKKLTEAARSGKALNQLLSELPQTEQQQILRVLTPSGVAGGVIAGVRND
jgi:hypothetical protein